MIAPPDLPDLPPLGQPDVAHLQLVARVLAFHTARLRELADGHRDDARFTSGLAWGLSALRRVDRALRGVTDPSALGFTPTDQEASPVNTILRYRVPLQTETAVDMPVGATLLHVGPPRDALPALDLWAVVDPDAPAEPRRILVVGTGVPTPDPRTYIGTVPTHGGEFIWHVFDGGPA